MLYIAEPNRNLVPSSVFIVKGERYELAKVILRTGENVVHSWDGNCERQFRWIERGGFLRPSKTKRRKK
jgi:hypothetical protein